VTRDDPQPTTPDDALATLLRELTEIHETIPRCAGCENFLGVVARVRDDLDEVATPSGDVATPSGDVGTRSGDVAREQLEAWLEAAEGRVKTTNHCEVCVPSGPYERFRAALARARDDFGPSQ
jgi:ribosomal protein L34E